jgi:hypothetical protein
MFNGSSRRLLRGLRLRAVIAARRVRYFVTVRVRQRVAGALATLLFLALFFAMGFFFLPVFFRLTGLTPIMTGISTPVHTVDERITRVIFEAFENTFVLFIKGCFHTLGHYACVTHAERFPPNAIFNFIGNGRAKYHVGHGFFCVVFTAAQSANGNETKND